MKLLLAILLVFTLSSNAFSAREIIHKNFSFQTINTSGTIVHTVTAGKTFYLTDIVMTVINANTADSICSIKDDSTVIIPFLSHKTMASNEGGGIEMIQSFKTPIPFSTSVKVFSGNGSGVTASVFVIGYEE